MCCTNPDNVYCFGTKFSNLSFFFAPICAACPVHIQSDLYRSFSTVKQLWSSRNDMTFFCCWLILLSSFYIELALVCCTNPDNIYCFGTKFSNLSFVFAPICAACPVHIQSDLYRSFSTVKQLWSSRNDMISKHQGIARRMKTKQLWFKVTRELCHEWFHHVRHHVHDGH